MKHTILGAGGAIANVLVPLLVARGDTVLLAGRNPAPVTGCTVVKADMTDRAQVLEAVRGSDVAYLVVGLRYTTAVWRAQWPAIMTNIIEACQQTGARLIFFDNVYMYGPVDGPMTEDAPFRPSSEKGKIRAAIASQLLDAMRAGSIHALIARSADFYGPNTANSVHDALVFDNLAKGKPAQWLVNAQVPHSLTYVPDAGRAVAMLAARPEAFGQTWHLPTHRSALTGRQFMSAASAAFGAPDKQMVLSKWMLWAFGLFNEPVRETYEMLYQSERSYIFDSSKFEKAFELVPTPYEEGIRNTAQSYRLKM